MGADRSDQPRDLDDLANEAPTAPVALDTAQRPTVAIPQTDDATLVEMAENERLSIQALIHEAWMREMTRKRGFAFRVSAQDQRVLELMLESMRNIPGPDVAR